MVKRARLTCFGPSRGLPPVVSPHNNWWLWGPKPADVLIAAGADLGYLEASFADVHLATTHHCDYCMSWRDKMPIYVAKRVRAPLEETWATAKRFE